MKILCSTWEGVTRTRKYFRKRRTQAWHFCPNRWVGELGSVQCPPTATDTKVCCDGSGKGGSSLILQPSHSQFSDFPAVTVRALPRLHWSLREPGVKHGAPGEGCVSRSPWAAPLLHEDVWHQAPFLQFTVALTSAAAWANGMLLLQPGLRWSPLQVGATRAVSTLSCRGG